MKLEPVSTQTILPEYMSPVIAWRAWQLVDGGIASLNGQPWIPGKRLAASCAAPGRAALPLGRAFPRHDAAAEVPGLNCSCGVYAARSLSCLRGMEYDRYGILGEVFLWGRVVEHENGWRGQFAYPKSFFLPSNKLGATLASVQSRLATLIAYKADIFASARGGSVLLWSATSGYQAEGLEWLIDRGQQYYERRRQERRLAVGDRVAIVGSGMAIVAAAEGEQIQAALGNRSLLTVKRKQVEWNKENRRWEILSAGPPVSEPVCAPRACSPPSPSRGRSLVAGGGGCNPRQEPFCATGLHDVQPDCTTCNRIAQVPTSSRSKKRILARATVICAAVAGAVEIGLGRPES